MKNALYFQNSFNRSNIIYQIKKKEKDDKVILDISEFIKNNYLKKSGIIYCCTIK